MRRVVRWSFALCSAACLGLCVAACVLWVRSHAVADELSLVSGGRGYYVGSSAGSLSYFASDTVVRRSDRRWRYARSAYPALRRADVQAIEGRIAARGGGSGFRVAGVAVRHSPPAGGARGPAVFVALPLWLVAISLALPPLLLWRRERYQCGAPEDRRTLVVESGRNPARADVV